MGPPNPNRGPLKHISPLSKTYRGHLGGLQGPPNDLSMKKEKPKKIPIGRGAFQRLFANPNRTCLHVGTYLTKLVIFCSLRKFLLLYLETIKRSNAIKFINSNAIFSKSLCSCEGATPQTHPTHLFICQNNEHEYKTSYGSQ